MTSAMSTPNKEERQKCWDARDSYWACLDEGKGADACGQQREALVGLCPSVWVKHFDRRYDYLKYKENLLKHGYDAPAPEKVAS